MTSTRIAQARSMYDAGLHTVKQIADTFGGSRPTIYRHLGTATGDPPPAAATRSRGNRLRMGRGTTPAAAEPRCQPRGRRELPAEKRLVTVLVTLVVPAERRR